MVMEIYSQTGANSRVLETDGEDMRDRDHECYFSGAHAAKDSGIALALGQAEGLHLPMAAASKGQFDTMIDKGIGELDKSGVAELPFKGRTACASRGEFHLAPQLGTGWTRPSLPKHRRRWAALFCFSLAPVAGICFFPRPLPGQGIRNGASAGHFRKDGKQSA